MRLMKIAVFASGNGTDLQAIIDGCKKGIINAEVALVISNNEAAYALSRAQKEDIPQYCINSDNYSSFEEFNDHLLAILNNHEIDLIFLAGYLKKISPRLIEAYPIFNIHPALLPKYGGKGMYGINIHAAVLAAGETETGITIHRVSAEYDQGEIIAQTKVEVLPEDTPESLQARVLEREHTFIVEVLKNIVEDIRKLKHRK